MPAGLRRLRRDRRARPRRGPRRRLRRRRHDSFPVKQGGIAAQQADAIAAVIALRGRAPSAADAAATSVLRAQLFGAPEPLFLEATLDATAGRSTALALDAESPWWPRGTLVGRHVTPWMAEQALAAA